MTGKPLTGTVLVAAFMVAGECEAQDSTLSTRLMQLNRTGEWSTAAELATAYLDSAGSVVDSESCQVLFSLAYARTRLRALEEARQGLERFDRACKNRSDVRWLRRPADELRDELAAARRGRPPLDGDRAPLVSANPGDLGLDLEALAEHERLCNDSGADACLVLYDGKIVQEWHGAGYREPMPTMSAVKSWVSLLAGILVAEGRLDIDDLVSRYIPEWTAGARAGVKVIHLLTMTAGLDRRVGSSGPNQSVGLVANKTEFVLALPLDRGPGEEWAYSNESVQLLSPILERAAGEPLEEYARRKLFAPLGMEGTSLRLDTNGNVWTYADAMTTLRDFAKPCQLALNNGVWGDRQVVPATWIKESTTGTSLNPGYGRLWWIVPGGYAARGYLGTNCYVLPGLELVVVRMQRTPNAPATTEYETPLLYPLFERIVNKTPQ